MIKCLNLRKIKKLIICILIGMLFAAVLAFAVLNAQNPSVEPNSPNLAAPPNEPQPSEPQPQTQRPFELTRRTSGTFYPLRDDDTRIVYLTFDDGPSYNVTPEILRILREHNVRATFFVLGSEVEKHPEIVRQMFDEGHTIANHSFTHVYRDIYASPQALIDEIKRTEDAINAALGFEYNNRLFRFPGGSHEKRAELKTAIFDLGFQFVDWNAVGNDSLTSRSIPAERIFQNIVTSANQSGHHQLTVLLHDNNTRMTSAEALPMIIHHFKELGYEFRTLCEM